MKLISTELSPDEAKEETGSPAQVADAPKFSYGTCLHLNDELVEKLGLKGKVQVGQCYKLEGLVEVTRYSENQQQDGENDCSADLQITEFGLAPDDSKDKEDAEYGRIGNLSGPTKY